MVCLCAGAEQFRKVFAVPLHRTVCANVDGRLCEGARATNAKAKGDRESSDAPLLRADSLKVNGGADAIAEPTWAND